MDNRFAYQKPTDDQVTSITDVRACCRGMQRLLEGLPMDERCRALALTKLEEVSMWANKGIVFPTGYTTEEPPHGR